MSGGAQAAEDAKFPSPNRPETVPDGSAETPAEDGGERPLPRLFWVGFQFGAGGVLLLAAAGLVWMELGR